MDDLISRAALAEKKFQKSECNGFGEGAAYRQGWNDAIDAIMDNEPSAQKKGHWNFVGDNLFKCTCCGEMYTTQQLNGLRVYDKDPYCPFFCPHCGADMRGEDDG